MGFKERIQPFVCIGIALLYIFAIINDFKILIDDTVYKVTGFNGSRTFGWKFKYLTYLDMVKLLLITYIIDHTMPIIHLLLNRTFRRFISSCVP